MTTPSNGPVDAEAPAPSRGFARWPFVLAGIVLVPVLLFAVYVWGTLNVSYSDGERAGIVQKFSRKGWVCKTYEGELTMPVAPGVAPTIWEFSVRDKAVVEQMNAALGRRVALHYNEHRGVPTSCFGLTDYYVDGVRVVQ
jgi:hypothetical protein